VSVDQDIFNNGIVEFLASDFHSATLVSKKNARD